MANKRIYVCLAIILATTINDLKAGTLSPSNNYPDNVEVCAHRLGKKMTYTEQTDMLYFNVSYSQYMTMAKARNIKVGCFASYYDFNNASIELAKQDEAGGHLWIDEYSLCPSLYKKITNYESPTEEEFISAYNNELLPAFVKTFGRKPVALSYAYGQQGFKGAVCPSYLGARNSGYNEKTDYGIGYGKPSDNSYSSLLFCSKASTMRWYDQAKKMKISFKNSWIYYLLKLMKHY